MIPHPPPRQLPHDHVVEVRRHHRAAAVLADEGGFPMGKVGYAERGGWGGGLHGAHFFLALSYRLARSSAATAINSLIVGLFRLIVCVASASAMAWSRLYRSSEILALTVRIFFDASSFVRAMPVSIDGKELFRKGFAIIADINYHYDSYYAACNYNYSPAI